MRRPDKVILYVNSGHGSRSNPFQTNEEKTCSIPCRNYIFVRRADKRAEKHRSIRTTSRGILSSMRVRQAVARSIQNRLSPTSNPQTVFLGTGGRGSHEFRPGEGRAKTGQFLIQPVSPEHVTPKYDILGQALRPSHTSPCYSTRPPSSPRVRSRDANYPHSLLLTTSSPL